MSALITFFALVVGIGGLGLLVAIVLIAVRRRGTP
jgi:hypothetical protein